MKRNTKSQLWVPLMAVALTASTAPLLAQQSGAPSSPDPSSSQNSIGQIERAEKLLGREVYSSDDQKIGKLDNLIYDLESGRILYGVVGASKGKVALAPQVFTTVTAKEIHANVDKNKIEGAPQFTSEVNKPEARGQVSFVSQVYQYFGQSPWWQGSSSPSEGAFHNVVKATELPGMKVENVNAEKLGKITDSAVNLSGGQLLYEILSPDSSLKQGNNLFPLPPMLFTQGTDHKILTANISKEQLATAPHFDKSTWPNLSDPTLASQVYQFYGKQPYFQAGGAMQPTGRGTPSSAPPSTTPKPNQ